MLLLPAIVGDGAALGVDVIVGVVVCVVVCVIVVIVVCFLSLLLLLLLLLHNQAVYKPVGHNKDFTPAIDSLPVWAPQQNSNF